jgi:hypothetical protein
MLVLVAATPRLEISANSVSSSGSATQGLEVLGGALRRLLLDLVRRGESLKSGTSLAGHVAGGARLVKKRVFVRVPRAQP